MIKFQRKIAKVTGGQISYLEKGSGPELLLMHGIGGNASSWRAQLQGLSENYRIIAWDAPGYGNSKLRTGTLEKYVAAVVGLLDFLDIRRAHILGHSMGGVIAQGVAGYAPDRLNKLILSSTFKGDGAMHNAPLQAGYLARLKDIETMKSEEFGRARAASMLAEPGAPGPRKELAQIAAEVGAAGLRAACELLNVADTSEILVDLKIPVLVLTGKNDCIIPLEKTNEMTELIPFAEQVEFLNSAHAAYIEEPLLFNNVVNDFLS